jgi:hypothetical protein
MAAEQVVSMMEVNGECVDHLDQFPEAVAEEREWKREGASQWTPGPEAWEAMRDS